MNAYGWMLAMLSIWQLPSVINTVLCTAKHILFTYKQEMNSQNQIFLLYKTKFKHVTFFWYIDNIYDQFCYVAWNICFSTTHKTTWFHGDDIRRKALFPVMWPISFVECTAWYVLLGTVAEQKAHLLPVGVKNKGCSDCQLSKTDIGLQCWFHLKSHIPLVQHHPSSVLLNTTE